MKVSIVGVGKVGSALGLTLVARHLVDELVLVGRRKAVAEAEALDLLHATAFGRPTTVRAGEIDATAGSDIIVLSIAAHVSQPGEERIAGGVSNYKALQQIVPALAAASPNAILLVATNPVDAMTTLAGPLSGFPAERVIGTGTLLDTMRLRLMLSERLGIHAGDLRAYVLGEHGPSQFAAFSSASAGGGKLTLSPNELTQIETAARHVGSDIMQAKGYTNHGIALAAAEVIESIVRDMRQVMPLCVRVEGFAGVNGVCVSLPVVIGRGGVLQRIDIQLSESETAAFHRSAGIVSRQVEEILAAASK